MTRGSDQPDPGVRTDADELRSARHVPGSGQDTAESPAVPAGHGPGPAVHELPSQSRTEPPTSAVHVEVPAHEMPTLPDWNSPTVDDPAPAVMACGVDHAVP